MKIMNFRVLKYSGMSDNQKDQVLVVDDEPDSLLEFKI